MDQQEDETSNTTASSSSTTTAPSKRSNDGGSSVLGAAINLFNSTIGSGVIGLGSAIAGTGGIVSAVLMITFAIMSKLSLDLVISLAIEAGPRASYEDLATKAFGTSGNFTIVLFKGVLSFGCLVSYVVIVRDNFSSSMQHLFKIQSSTEEIAIECVMSTVLLNEGLMAVILSASVMLPLSCLRSMTPLVRFSAIKILVVFLVTIILVVLHQRIGGVNDPTGIGSRFEHWIQIRPNILSNFGTMLFGFVCQHTCNLCFQSLRPEIRNVKEWKKVSSLSMTMSVFIPSRLFILHDVLGKNR